MKKVFCAVMLAVLSLTVSFEALELGYSSGLFSVVRAEAARAKTRAKSKKKTQTAQTNTETAYQWEFGALSKSLYELAQRIADYNKCAFETKVTKREREEWGGNDRLNRCWAKDKTIVAGTIDAKGVCFAYYIHTGDPEMTFTGGIKVGASTSTLEKYFEQPLNKIGWSAELLANAGFASKASGVCFLCEAGMGENLRILYKNGKITEIEWYFIDDERPFLARTANFVSKKEQEFGLSRGFLGQLHEKMKREGMPQ